MRWRFHFLRILYLCVHLAHYAVLGTWFDEQNELKLLPDISNIEQYNANASNTLYPAWKYAGIFYSPSIRPNLALPENMKLTDSNKKYLFPQFFSNDTTAPADIVSVRIAPFSVTMLDEIEQYIAIDLIVITSWKDWRLAFNTRNESDVLESRCFHLDQDNIGQMDGSYELQFEPGTTAPLNIWNPKATADVYDAETTPEMIYEYTMLCGDSSMTQFSHGIYSFKINMDRRKYPFDNHVLTLGFFNPMYSPSQVKVVIENDQRQWVGDNGLQGWNVGPFNIESRFRFTSKGTRDPSLLSTGVLYTQDELKVILSNATHEQAVELLALTNGPFEIIYCSFEVDRIQTYYILTQTLPMSVVVFMSSMTFFLYIDNIELRLTTAITAVLTIMAFSSFLGSSLPEVGYLTWSHVVLITAYSFTLYVLFHVVVVAVLLTEDLREIFDEEKYGVKRVQLFVYLGKKKEELDLSEEMLVSKVQKRYSVHQKAQNRLESTLIEDWTISDVKFFLDSQGFYTIAENALTRQINGKVLVELPVEAYSELGALDLVEAAQILAKLGDYKKLRKTRGSFRFDGFFLCIKAKSDEECEEMLEDLRSLNLDAKHERERQKLLRKEKRKIFLQRQVLTFKQLMVILDSQMVSSTTVLLLLLLWLLLLSSSLLSRDNNSQSGRKSPPRREEFSSSSCFCI